MILDRKHLSFLVQVIDRGHLNAADGSAKCRVLDSFEFLNKAQDGEVLRNQIGAACIKKRRR